MDISTDDAHRETLRMLREALDFLERLPAVPVTRAICARVELHLNEPTHRLLAQSAQARVGTAYTVVGLPFLEVRLDDDTVKLSVPDALESEAREQALTALCEALARGPLSIGVRSRTRF